MTISPPGIISVCNGDQLELMCNKTTGGILEWSFSLNPENVTNINNMRYDRVISSSSPEDQTSHILVNSIRFTFSRVSAQNSLPLVARLVVGGLMIK